MKLAKSKLVVELICSVGAVWAIYLTLWIANLHDTSRRWMLLVCLFAVWLSFNLGRSVGLRAKRGTNPRESQEMGLSLARVVWSFIGMVSIMLSLGLLLRLTA